MNEIPTEYVNIATERIVRSFGDIIGGHPMILERIVFDVISGDRVFESDDDEEE